MLSLNHNRIFLYRESINMHKSFEGLSAIIQRAFSGELFTGAYFVFLNRSRKCMKLLFWDGDGYTIYYKRLEKGSCTLKLPKDLPVEIIVNELTPEERIDPKTGEEMVEFDSEIVDKLACKPGSWYIKRFIYKKYRVPGNTLAEIKQKEAVDSIIPGSKFDESFMAKVVTDKLAYHIPFYRQQEMLKCSEIVINKQ